MSYFKKSFLVTFLFLLLSFLFISNTHAACIDVASGPCPEANPFLCVDQGQSQCCTESQTECNTNYLTVTALTVSSCTSEELIFNYTSNFNLPVSGGNVSWNSPSGSGGTRTTAFTVSGNQGRGVSAQLVFTAPERASYSDGDTVIVDLVDTTWTNPGATASVSCNHPSGTPNSTCAGVGAVTAQCTFVDLGGQACQERGDMCDDANVCCGGLECDTGFCVVGAGQCVPLASTCDPTTQNCECYINDDCCGSENGGVICSEGSCTQTACAAAGGECRTIMHNVCPPNAGFNPQPIGGFNELDCTGGTACCTPLASTCAAWSPVSGCPDGSDGEEMQRCSPDNGSVGIICCESEDQCPLFDPTWARYYLDIFCDSSGRPTSIPSDTLYTAVGCVSASGTGAFTADVLAWSVGIIGGIAMILFIIAGVMIKLSGGNPQRLQTGKDLLWAALTGLFLALFAAFILNLIGVSIFGIPELGL